jgi:hypothetical protein
MKWMISEDRLGTDQREVIDEIGQISTRPIWIKGHAGSGKSVLLLHSLKDYLVRNPTAKVCVVVYTHSLVDLMKNGLSQIPFLSTRTIDVLTIYGIMDKINANVKYKAIFCDEIQDLPLEFITKMKNASTHLIMAGDSSQSIYPTVKGLSMIPTNPASPQEINKTIAPIEKKLGVIYRLTSTVISMLKNVFTDMLTDIPRIGNEDTQIKLFESTSTEAEIKYCWESAKETNYLRPSDVCAILISGKKSIVKFVNTVLQLEKKGEWQVVENSFGEIDFGSMNNHLHANGIPLVLIGNGYGLLEKADKENKIVVMTYHSAKGLDFDYVFLPMVGSDMWLHSSVPVNALLLVALSRSKSGLTITYTGSLYRPLTPFLNGILSRPLPENNNNNEVVF